MSYEHNFLALVYNFTCSCVTFTAVGGRFWPNFPLWRVNCYFFISVTFGHYNSCGFSAKNRVTLWVNHAVVYLFEIHDQENMQNKKNHRSIFSTSKYIPKFHVFNILTFRGCQGDVIRRHMTSSIITLTIPDYVWHISRKSYHRSLRYSHFPQDSDWKYASGKYPLPWALWALSYN